MPSPAAASCGALTGSAARKFRLLAYDVSPARGFATMNGFWSAPGLPSTLCITFEANRTGAGEVEVWPNTGRVKPSEKKNLSLLEADDAEEDAEEDEEVLGAWDST